MASNQLRQISARLPEPLRFGLFFLREFVAYPWLRRHAILKPRVLQLPVNDICNSRCIMCNIWRQKRGKQISAVELAHVLRDPLFGRVEHVGISGGEPTLRPDLAELGEAVASTLPRIKSMSVISNGLSPSQVAERILALSEVARRRDIRFDVSLSLDGLGPVHDANRGVEGSFSNVLQSVDTLREQGLPVACCCTITPINAYWADDVRLWSREQGIPCTFRVATEIARVYNQGYSAEHPFTHEQLLHLCLFFEELANDATVAFRRRLFYASLARQLVSHTPRKAGCDWQYHGVTLDSRGDVSYCSVESSVMGSALERSAWELYRGGVETRANIVQTKCQACVHDLSGPTSPPDLSRELAVRMDRRFRHLLTSARAKVPLIRTYRRQQSGHTIQPANWRSVLIIGWWGTETAGDRAILGELVHLLKQVAPTCSITLSTLDDRVSRQTAREIGLEDYGLRVLPDCSTRTVVREFDAVIIGGGPLMQVEQLPHIHGAFRAATCERKDTVIFGCGVGPLHSRYYRTMVADICRMASVGFFRDEQSLNFALQAGATGTLDYACDPAVGFVHRWLSQGQLSSQAERQHRHLAVLMRANTCEYQRERGSALGSGNDRVARTVGEALHSLSEHEGFAVDLLAMHALRQGGDDRLFARSIAHYSRLDGCVSVQRAYLTLQELLSDLLGAELAVVMRFHAHLFCLALGLPFVSVDYSGPHGKVRNLLQGLAWPDWASLRWEGFTSEELIRGVTRAAAQQTEIRSQLVTQRDAMLNRLGSVYTNLFGAGL